MTNPNATAPSASDYDGTFGGSPHPHHLLHHSLCAHVPVNVSIFAFAAVVVVVAAARKESTVGVGTVENVVVEKVVLFQNQ